LLDSRKTINSEDKRKSTEERKAILKKFDKKVDSDEEDDNTKTRLFINFPNNFAIKNLLISWTKCEKK